MEFARADPAIAKMREELGDVASEGELRQVHQPVPPSHVMVQYRTSQMPRGLILFLAKGTAVHVLC